MASLSRIFPVVGFAAGFAASRVLGLRESKTTTASLPCLSEVAQAFRDGHGSNISSLCNKNIRTCAENAECRDAMGKILEEEKRLGEILQQLGINICSSKCSKS